MNGVEQNDVLWARIASILGVERSDAETRQSIILAGRAWQEFEVEDFAASSDMKKDLEAVAVASKVLSNRAERIRRHVQMQMLMVHNGVPLDEDDSNNPFADEHIAAVIQLGKLCDALAETMTSPRGRKGDAPRRASWAQATALYEDCTGRAASFGRNAEQQITGPWVEFIRAFSAFVMPPEIPDDGAIEAFHKHRKRLIKEGSNPVSASFFGT